MNRLERRAEKLAKLVAAVVRELFDTDAPVPTVATAADHESLATVLREQMAQREKIFAFDVVVLVFDHGVAQITAVQNRIGLLIAGEIAIEAALLLKASEYVSGPNLLVLLNIVVTAVLFRAAGEADSVAAEPFAKAFGEHPWRTRDTLANQLRAAIVRNGRIARGQQRLYAGRGW